MASPITNGIIGLTIRSMGIPVMEEDTNRLVAKGARFRKGHVVTAEDIPVLLSMGKDYLYIWEKQERCFVRCVSSFIGIILLFRQWMSHWEIFLGPHLRDAGGADQPHPRPRGIQRGHDHALCDRGGQVMEQEEKRAGEIHGTKV